MLGHERRSTVNFVPENTSYGIRFIKGCLVFRADEESRRDEWSAEFTGHRPSASKLSGTRDSGRLKTP